MKIILKILVTEGFEESGIFESWSKTCLVAAVYNLIRVGVFTFLK